MTSIPLDLRGVALLLNQGETLQQAVATVGQRPGSQSWLRAADRLAQGTPLSEALGEVTDLPDGLHLWLDERLEGRLPAAFVRVARLLEESQQRRRLWRSMLIYPVLLLAAVQFNLVFVSFISLQIQAAVAGMDVQSSLLEVIHWLSSAVMTLAPVLLLLPVGLAGLLLSHSARLRLPWLGEIFRMREAIAFFGWLEPAMACQPSLPEAVRMASAGCCSAPLAGQLRRLADRLQAGATLEQALPQTRLLPATARWLLAQAESRQFVPGTLETLSEVLEQNLEFQLAFAWTLFYLGLYLLIGVAACWVLGTLFVPMLAVVQLV